MLSGRDGSSGTKVPAIRSAGRTIYRQRNLALLAENAFLRQQNAELNERIEELENRLKQYENAHTPSSKQGGAGQPPQNDGPDQDDANDEAGGDSDAASDSSPGRNPGHDGTTQPPPDPDRTGPSGSGRHTVPIATASSPIPTETLERSLNAVGQNGHVHLIGVLAGTTGEIDSSPVMWKAVNLEGVSGVGSRAMFDRMNRAIEATEFEPVIDRTFAFDEVREAYRYLESGQHQGKIVITVD